MGNKINHMQKFDKYRKINLSHFDNTIGRYKNGPKAVSWGSGESQECRFKILSEIGVLDNKTILDVGCGLGDFYGYLARNKIKPKSYLGIDINPLMVSGAKKKYPKAEFMAGDLIDMFPKRNFDYVFQSGIFNLKFPNWEKITYKILAKMYGLSKIGVGTNFLSVLSPFSRDKSSFYADPKKIIDFVCSDLSKRFVLRHDYRPNDFTIYIYKDK